VIIGYLAKKHLVFKVTEILSRCAQNPAILPYTKPIIEPVQIPTPCFTNVILILSSHPSQGKMWKHTDGDDDDDDMI
jgi:hypothetical protein